jgi:hypothetical protein
MNKLVKIEQDFRNLLEIIELQRPGYITASCEDVSDEIKARLHQKIIFIPQQDSHLLTRIPTPKMLTFSLALVLSLVNRL